LDLEENQFENLDTEFFVEKATGGWKYVEK
jgi:hypothetical protein